MLTMLSRWRTAAALAMYRIARPYLKRLARFFGPIFNADTKPTRFWIAMVDIGFAFWTLAPDSMDDMEYMNKIVSSDRPVELWAVIFIAHAVILIHGLRGRWNMLQLFLEWVFGVSLWAFTAFASMAAQGGLPGPSMAILAMNVWCLVSNPYHKGWGRYE